MTEKYLSLARRGKNDWWRYFVSILIILACYQVVGIIPMIVLSVALSLDNDPTTQLSPETGQFEGIPPLLPYLTVNFILVSLLIGLYISLRLLHERHLITLITPKSQISWKRVFSGFGVYFALLCLIGIVGLIFFPVSYRVSFNPAQFFIFLPIALILTPIQTSAEELFFRGYLMQWIALKAKKPIIPILVSSLIFMLPHLLNPEADLNLLVMSSFYFLFGVFLAFVTVWDNSLELALGAHAANNLFVVLIVNYEDSALPSSPIFTATQFSPLASLLGFLAIATVFCGVFMRKRKPANSSHKSV